MRVFGKNPNSFHYFIRQFSDLTGCMIWLGSAELGWAPEVLNLKTNLTELKKCLDDGVRNMVCSFGTVLCRARVGFDDPCESLPTQHILCDSLIL